MSGEEAVLIHAGHVLLDEGLEELLHRLLVGQLADEVLFLEFVGLETIDGSRLVAVEL